MNLNVLDPLTHTLDIVEQLLADGREDEAMELLGRVDDVLERRCLEILRKGDET